MTQANARCEPCLDPDLNTLNYKKSFWGLEKFEYGLSVSQGIIVDFV